MIEPVQNDKGDRENKDSPDKSPDPDFFRTNACYHVSNQEPVGQDQEKEVPGGRIPDQPVAQYIEISSIGSFRLPDMAIAQVLYQAYHIIAILLKGIAVQVLRPVRHTVIIDGPFNKGIIQTGDPCRF